MVARSQSECLLPPLTSAATEALNGKQFRQLRAFVDLEHLDERSVSEEADVACTDGMRQGLSYIVPTVSISMAIDSQAAYKHRRNARYQLPVLKESHRSHLSGC